MRLTVRSLIWICITVGCWAFSFGAGSQVVSKWLNDEHRTSDTIIGLAHSFYYFGMAAGSFCVPALARRLGSITCVALGGILSSISLAVFPWAEAEWIWYALRFINGWGGALCVVPLETIVSRDSMEVVRTRNFAFYGVALTLGGALGFAGAPLLYGIGYRETFWIGAGPPLFAAILFFIQMRSYPEHPEEAVLDSFAWRANILSYGTAWTQGFLEGILVAFLQLFLEARHFTSEQAGLLMGVTTVGVILFQVPVSFLADRVGKTPTLLACYGVVVLGLLTIPWINDMIALAFVLFTFGGCSGAMYPLGLSLLGDRIAPAGLARAYAAFLVIECIGSQAGSAAAGVARDAWGQTSMFGVGLASTLIILVLWLVLRVPIAPPTHRDSSES